MQRVPKKMTELLRKSKLEFPPLQQLIDETSVFANAECLHKELERTVFAMLEQKKEIVFALHILFYLGKIGKSAGEDFGTLSAVLDSRELIKAGMSAATANFTNALNKKLLEGDVAITKEASEKEMDAFGQVFEPFEEPMPTVKLAAGFNVSLRTMFGGQPCQERYGRIENATYPISKETRLELQSALVWLSSEERRGITWSNTDAGEVLFAYPEWLQKNMYSMVDFLHSTAPDKKNSKAKEESGKKAEFEVSAKAFISELKKTKQTGTDPMSERIQYFILRKLDKARTKVVYTYNTSPAEIERCSEEWSLGCQNLPKILFTHPKTLFPLEASDILNQVWWQDGNPAKDDFKPIARYHGMQILFGEEPSAVHRDLSVLMSNMANLAPYLGRNRLIRQGGRGSQDVLLNQTGRTMALMGLLLYKLGVRKEKYMQEFPYLFGQLLKVSDALHEMYCKVERDNDVPNTLAGSGLFITGMEQPYKTLAMLGQRMSHYIAWAKSYRTKDIKKKDEESERVGGYLTLYEQITTQIYSIWGNLTRFNDEEKAQYFIGYLAAFPQKAEIQGQSNSEEVENEKNKISNDVQEKI